MKRYRVILEVVYPVSVEAENEEEAIEQALLECPYDNADEVEPVVEEIEETEKTTEKWCDNYEEYQNASNNATFSQYPIYRG